MAWSSAYRWDLETTVTFPEQLKVNIEDKTGKLHLLSYGFVYAGVAFGSGDFLEQLQAFFFCWGFYAYAAISTNVNSIVSSIANFISLFILTHF
jgi:hypothetical protein